MCSQICFRPPFARSPCCDHSAAAIVADGAGVRSVVELKDLSLGASFIQWPIAGAMTVGTAVIKGDMPPSAMSGKVDDIQSPVMYIASQNVDDELELNRKWADKTNAEHELWEVDAGYTGGLKTHPAEYETRVIAWFDAHLLQQAR